MWWCSFASAFTKTHKRVTKMTIRLETLASLDMVVVVFVTDNVDIGTIHVYGRDSDRTLAELTEQAIECFIMEYASEEDGIDAAKGFEVMSVAR